MLPKQNQKLKINITKERIENIEFTIQNLGEKLWFVYDIDVFSFVSNKDMARTEELVLTEQILVALSDGTIKFGEKDIAKYIFSGKAKMDIIKGLQEQYLSFEEENKNEKKKKNMILERFSLALKTLAGK